MENVESTRDWKKKNSRDEKAVVVNNFFFLYFSFFKYLKSKTVVCFVSLKRDRRLGALSILDTSRAPGARRYAASFSDCAARNSTRYTLHLAQRLLSTGFSNTFV